ncbi:MAG: acyl-CoA thioesterase [Chloroflexi bacterium]|nr:acyl-CoA thioesterase [Chloroflexota bacterium]
MSPRSRPVEGGSRYRHPIEVRFADTDALGHVNNAVYLSYFEAARAGYYAALAGVPFGYGATGERHTFLIAEARVTYRLPAFFGEPLICECRVAWAGRSSFGLGYRVVSEGSAVAPARVVADGDTVQVMYDLRAGRVVRVPADLLELMERFEGRKIPARPISLADGGGAGSR